MKCELWNNFFENETQSELRMMSDIITEMPAERAGDKLTEILIPFFEISLSTINRQIQNWTKFYLGFVCNKNGISMQYKCAMSMQYKCAI